MKKIFCILTVLLLMLSLSACSKDMLTAEVIAQYPWLVGNWGQDDGYFTQDVTVVMNGDGTCTVAGIPGTWTVSKDWEIVYKVPVEITLENDELYTGEFVNDKDLLFFTIWNEKTGQSYNGDYISPEVRQNPLEKLGHVIGTWSSIPNSFAPFSEWEEMMEIREDGTCSILGKEGIWLTDDIHCDVSEGTSYSLKAKVHEQILNISIFDTAINNFDSVAVFDEEGQRLANFSGLNLSNLEVIEITEENLWDYFEVTDYSIWETDDFGDFSALTVPSYLHIKDEYAEQVILMNELIAVELEWDTVRLTISADPLTETWEVLSSESGTTGTDVDKLTELHALGIGNSFGAYISRFSHSVDEVQCSGHTGNTAYRVLRAAGTLFLLTQ